MNTNKTSAQKHAKANEEARKKIGGIIETTSKVSMTSASDLATFYTPGVAHISEIIRDNPEKAKELTIKKDTVMIISDGSAVLGLGNSGPLSVMPVLEGKAMILKQFGGINASPMVLDTQDVDEMFTTIKNIAIGFGGVFLEDISAPRCFELEDRLAQALDMPVFHDDQHGTAIVVLGAMINAFKLTKKEKAKAKVVLVGAGAAGIACGKLLKAYGFKNLVLLDSKGIVSHDRCEAGQDCLPFHKKEFASEKGGDLAAAVKNADVFIGVSKPGILTPEMIQTMNNDPVIFALANPVPEIYPDEALAAGAGIVATGRSDFPNQINNALVFPGLFRGLLDKNVKKVTPEMKIRAAEALAAMVKNPHKEKILPGVFDKGLAEIIAKSV